jgi:YVTN family beta-propeller protein
VWGIALTHDGKKLYTCDGVSNTVSVVDTGSLKMIKQLKSEGGPWGVVIDD